MEVEAWLFKCWKPGRVCVFASIDENDNTWWDEGWMRVMRIPLGRIPGPVGESTILCEDGKHKS